MFDFDAHKAMKQTKPMNNKELLNERKPLNFTNEKPVKMASYNNPQEWELI